MTSALLALLQCRIGVISGGGAFPMFQDTIKIRSMSNRRGCTFSRDFAEEEVEVESSKDPPTPAAFDVDMTRALGPRLPGERFSDRLVLVGLTDNGGTGSDPLRCVIVSLCCPSTSD